MMGESPVEVKRPAGYSTHDPDYRDAPDLRLMLRPLAAWRAVCKRTGGSITIQTFYRWLRSGQVHSIRVGGRIFVPEYEVEQLIERCLSDKPD